MHFPSNIGTSQTQLKNNSRDKKKVQVIDTRPYSNNNIIFEYTILMLLKYLLNTKIMECTQDLTNSTYDSKKNIKTRHCAMYIL